MHFVDRLRQQKHGRFRGAGPLVAGNVVSGVSATAAVPLLSRLYSPEQFALLAVFTAALGLINTVSSLRYELVIPVAQDEGDADRVTLVALALIGMSAVTVMCVAIGLGLAQGWVWWIPLLALGVAVVGVFEVGRYRALREHRHVDIGRAVATQGVGAVAVQVLGGLAVAGAAPLLLGSIVGRAAGMGAVWGRVRLGRVREPLLRRGRSGLVAVGREHSSFARHAAPAALVGSLAVNGLPIGLSGVHDAFVVGQFAMVFRVLTLSTRLLGQALGQHYYAIAATAIRGGRPDDALRQFRTISVRLTILGGVLVLVTVVLGPWAFPTVLGERWDLAGEMSPWVSLIGGAGLAVSPLTQTLNLLGRNRTQLRWDAIRMSLLGGILLIAAVSGTDPVTTVAMVSVVLSGSYAWHWFLSRKALRAFAAAADT